MQECKNAGMQECRVVTDFNRLINIIFELTHLFLNPFEYLNNIDCIPAFLH